MLNKVTPFAWLEFDTATSNTVAGNEHFNHLDTPRVYLIEDAHGLTFNAPVQNQLATEQSGRDTNKHSAEKALYEALTQGSLTRKNKLFSQQFILEQLQAVQDMPSDLPENIDDILAWIEDNNERVGVQYREYLDSRKAGGRRRFFSTKSHALNFLQCVAPTKLVDGAWLYGFAKQWDDVRLSALIRIYLEELGDGQPSKNHVALYKKLLAENQCVQWQDLPDHYFMQGAIQLALGHNTDEFLPEAIGFNLGYEQLPLHLLITAYELNELNIDPYYFTLHVTVDNASSGHARQSLQALLDNTPDAGKAEFSRRVADGYKLNQLGVSTTDIISSFDLGEEFIAILAAKSAYGKNMHSDYCRIGGRTVNEWLSDKTQIPQFIDSLVEKGWIIRHQDPQQSRFWKLLQSDKAEMFGVFNPYELQVIYDWIAGDALRNGERSLDAVNTATFPPRQNSFRMSQRRLETERAESVVMAQGEIATERHLSYRANDDHYLADTETVKLESRIAGMEGREEIMHVLAGYISPAKHHTPAGLLATRLYKVMLDTNSSI